MSTRTKKAKYFPIGVDLGTRFLKVAQVRLTADGKLALVAATSVETPRLPQADTSTRARMIGETVGQMCHDHQFKGTQCVLSLPAELTFLQHMKMDKMPDDQLASALKWELTSKLPYDPSEAEIRHVVAGDIYVDNTPKQEVIAVGARRDAIEAYVEAFRRVKLECVGVNVEPCAIVECFARLFRRSHDAKRAVLFVDIGATSTQVVISHGPSLVFAKNLALGGAQFDDAVGAVLNMPSEDARQERMSLDRGNTADPHVTVFNQAMAGPVGNLEQELTNCLRYYDSVFVNSPVERVVFLGGQAYDKVLCQTLAQKLGLPAQIGDPLAQIELDSLSAGATESKTAAVRPDWAVAVGLGLGAAHAGHAA
jgi:type IV pilus assembly protein PilM